MTTIRYVVYCDGCGRSRPKFADLADRDDSLATEHGWHYAGKCPICMGFLDYCPECFAKKRDRLHGTATIRQQCWYIQDETVKEGTRVVLEREGRFDTFGVVYDADGQHVGDCIRTFLSRESALGTLKYDLYIQRALRALRKQLGGTRGGQLAMRLLG